MHLKDGLLTHLFTLSRMNALKLDRHKKFIPAAWKDFDDPHFVTREQEGDRSNEKAAKPSVTFGILSFEFELICLTTIIARLLWAVFGSFWTALRSFILSDDFIFYIYL